MTTFDLTYNPFTKEKKFRKDDKEENFDECWGAGNKELSEWCNVFFEKLYEKYNDPEMEVTFKGILRDYEFLVDAKAAYEKKNSSAKITLKNNGGADTNEKLGKLKKLFEKMQEETPFDSLKSKGGKELFNKIVSSEFEMAVVATMSSGKSTLINAMLGHELLPARNEATTATLARIHDIDGAKHFSGKSRDADGNELLSCEHLTLENMNKLNDDKNTSVIDIYGDIVGIKSKDLQLVLTDTPGPNNSRTDEHKEHTYSLLKEDYKPMILYVLNGTQLETNDDNTLLKDVAAAMNSGGRQAQERFIFVLNKADEFDPDKGETISKKIGDVKAYLERHNIHNARVFPAAARLAKVLRQSQNNQPLTESEEDDILPKYKSFIKRENKHFSDHAPLSPAAKKIQDSMLTEAKNNGNKYQEALIYTGIPAIELAISEYLSKYALPAKITEGVYSFKDKIDKLGIEAEATRKLENNKDEVEKLSAALQAIENALKNGGKADEVRRKIEGLSVEGELEGKFEEIRSSLVVRILTETQSMKKDKIHRETAEEHCKSLRKILPELETKFRVDVKNTLDEVLKRQAEEAVAEYKKYLEDLLGSFPYEIPPATILGDLASISVEGTLNDYSHFEDVEVGSHQEKNTKKKWYKFWTWFQPNYVTVKDYEEQEFVNFSEYLESEIMHGIHKSVKSTKALVFEHAKKEERDFKSFFKRQLAKLNEAIENKTAEKQKNLESKENVEKMIEENKKNLKWITDFKNELDSLLAI